MATRPSKPSGAAAITLTGSIFLSSGDQNWGSQRRMALLAAIGQEGSITAAAKKIGISYKAAWDAVDAMNNLAGEPLVLRSTGGQRGGGALLTARARELIDIYQKVEAEHRHFIARVTNAGGKSTPNLELFGHMMIQTSARNKLAATVRQIKAGAVNDEVILDMGDGCELVASITHESVRNLKLKPGRRALAFIKATSVIVGRPGTGLTLSARNQLPGHISRITVGAVNSEVCIEIGAGRVIAAMVSREGVTKLGLKKGDPAIAIFKASSVMLGVTD
jgi:molybdate transport system regulatory protein